ncbi:hypothetical protein [Micromonospora peucetia]|uniref:Uncharacterized protein n=1 Tax=Micromonospora peucetia TaxID=47871 RepID=A0ABZ1EKB0_9ACTN|nr:hypothetical protein [Micromonospora peucetia]WSA34709.1 hypothetical protein OIE14_11995 [Micromonospora peucetia]
MATTLGPGDAARRRCQTRAQHPDRLLFQRIEHYGFTLVNEGVKVRRAVYTNGELTVDDGEPLSIEANIPDPGSDENWVWAIIEHVTGTGYNGNRTFQVYTCPW